MVLVGEDHLLEQMPRLDRMGVAAHGDIDRLDACREQALDLLDRRDVFVDDLAIGARSAVPMVEPCRKPT